MGFFNALVKIAVDTVTLPIDIAKDIVTLGGIATDRGGTYTGEKLEQIKQDAEEADK